MDSKEKTFLLDLPPEILLKIMQKCLRPKRIQDLECFDDPATLFHVDKFLTTFQTLALVSKTFADLLKEANILEGIEVTIRDLDQLERLHRFLTTFVNGKRMKINSLNLVFEATSERFNVNRSLLAATLNGTAESKRLNDLLADILAIVANFGEVKHLSLKWLQFIPLSSASDVLAKNLGAFRDLRSLSLVGFMPSDSHLNVALTVSCLESILIASPRLQSLELYCPHNITNAALASANPDLKELRISVWSKQFNTATNVSVDLDYGLLERFNQLETLAGPFQGGQILPWISKIKTLRHLELRSMPEDANNLIEASTALIEMTSMMFPGIKSLKLWPVIDISTECFDQFWSVFPNLEELQLYFPPSNCFQSDIPNLLEAIATGPTNLKRLGLVVADHTGKCNSKAQFAKSSSGMTLSKPVGSFRFLEELSLQIVCMKNALITAQFAFRMCPNLTKLKVLLSNEGQDQNILSVSGKWIADNEGPVFIRENMLFGKWLCLIHQTLPKLQVVTVYDNSPGNSSETEINFKSKNPPKKRSLFMTDCTKFFPPCIEKERHFNERREITSQYF